MRLSGRSRLVAGAGAALCALVLTPATAKTPAPPPRAPEAIYARVCGYCHGQHVAPVIRGRGLPADLIRQYVRTGPRAMPAFRPTEISDAELAALARWVSTSKADPREHEQ